MAQYKPPSIFEMAEVAPSAKTPKSNNNNLQVSGIEDLAALRIMRDSLDSMISELSSNIVTEARDIFIAEGCQAKTRPSNYTAFDGLSRASVELKRRSSASALGDAEIALLRNFKIPTNTITEIAETYIINPEYVGDQKVLAAASARLLGAPGIPRDFIQKQNGKSKTVVTDESITAMFKLPMKAVQQCISVCCNITIGKSAYTGPIADAFNIAMKLFRRNCQFLETPTPRGKRSI